LSSIVRCARREERPEMLKLIQKAQQALKVTAETKTEQALCGQAILSVRDVAGLKQLLEMKADVNAADEQGNALSHAIDYVDSAQFAAEPEIGELVRALVEAKCDVNHTNAYGRSVISKAHCSEVVELLLDLDANPDLPQPGGAPTLLDHHIKDYLGSKPWNQDVYGGHEWGLLDTDAQLRIIKALLRRGHRPQDQFTFNKLLKKLSSDSELHALASEKGRIPASD